ncbi:MAG: hypothetical protein HC917_24955 [Richelia sp. SM2_1_7]|nr:hypothetical protein [Richelia sp. SM2_1_7]
MNKILVLIPNPETSIQGYNVLEGFTGKLRYVLTDEQLNQVKIEVLQELNDILAENIQKKDVLEILQVIERMKLELMSLKI